MAEYCIFMMKAYQVWNWSICEIYVDPEITQWSLQNCNYVKL